MRTILFSRHFPTGHPKQGQPTYFVEQVLNSILPRPLTVGMYEFPPAARDYINDFMVIEGQMLKHHTIRLNNRWKPGDKASLRIWSGKAYRSEQIEFARVEIKKTWPFEITKDGYLLNGKEMGYDGLKILAQNDGLTVDDFEGWFALKSKTGLMKGQVICWNDKIDYP